MNISAVSASSQRFSVSNRGENTKALPIEKYENPVNRSTEKGLAILSSSSAGLVLGAGAAGIASCFVEGGFKSNKKMLAGIAALTALVYTAVNLPAKLYKTKLQSFAREKEMDVYSRETSLKSNIMEEADKEVRDKTVDLDTKINHYAAIQMANNGSGVMIKHQ